MGKKSGKGKEKKLRRKEEQAKLSAAQSVVDAANAVDDLMKPLTPFTKYDRNGLIVSIGCKRISELSEEEFNWAFDLTKDNMQTLVCVGAEDLGDERGGAKQAGDTP
ncbi:N-alpha-acetyltransferase 40 [Paramuricea clavata]|uniref:N-alpha-acetyltransferase 40 n=2 Tax=Paramuricea clavata TaxID=317549 RepID=A0A7D9LDA0_PARCT|nr:N-alpha-acetyltransferase 40 [Paramuricea clavata]